MKRYLIVGFGRMGVTHLAHLNGLHKGDCAFDVFDPSLAFRVASLFRMRSNIRFLRRIPSVGAYDCVLITSPPDAHSNNLRAVLGLTDRVFIEKPLALTKEDVLNARKTGVGIRCGYVLRHNACVAFLESVIRDRTPTRVEVSVESNLGLQGGDDWRYRLSQGGGCINELGSHALNLGLVYWKEYISGSTSIQVDEICVPRFDFSLGGGETLTVKGDWNVDVRKTIYRLRISGNGFDLTTDLQSVEGSNEGRQVTWAPRVEPLKLRYYMRGAEFALQSEDIAFGDFSDDELNDSVSSDEILKRVLGHA